LLTDPRILRYLLGLQRPDEWAVPHEGGARVVGYIAKKPEHNTMANGKSQEWQSCLGRSQEAKA
jgi:hypothetical protein